MQKIYLKTLLRKQGFSPCKAELWAEFVRQVWEIYRQATDKLLTQEHWERFKQKKGALGAAKKQAGKKSARIPIEDALTSEINIFVEELRCSLALDHFLRKHEVNFQCEVLVPSDNRAGRHSKKIDLLVKSAFPDGPELAIEAKPLTSDKDVDNRYLGQDGIGCFFTDDSPYTKGPLGAMLAYTICNNNLSKQEQILNGLKKYLPAAIDITRVVINGNDEVDCSHHDRSIWRLIPITILHLECIFPSEIQDTVE